MTHVVDTAFRDAVHAAAQGNGNALADILMSDAPLGDGERAMLANLVRGGYRPPRGKRPAMRYADQRKIAVEYVERLEANEASDAILADLRARHGAERSTVLGWAAEIRRAEESVSAGKSESDARLAVRQMRTEIKSS